MSENFKETFKTVILAVLIVLFLPLVLVFCILVGRRSSGSGHFEETYIRDIVDRNDVRNRAEIKELLDVVASLIGGLTNPKKLSVTFKSVKGVTIHPDTVKSYLDYLEDSFLISKVRRYDVKGKRYINTPP